VWSSAEGCEATARYHGRVYLVGARARARARARVRARDRDRARDRVRVSSQWKG
jgi:hypothetical protein